MKKKRKSSGIIIIGNEILSGKTQETNSNFVCKNLFEIGVECCEVSVISDNKFIISDKVNYFRSKYDYVFTSGGIGPTHDDITSESIAYAFKKELCINEIAKERLMKHYSDDVLTEARLKMAFLPKDVSLIDNPVSVAPGFILENVYVLPGVPQIFKIMALEIIKSIDEGEKFFKKTVSTKLSEGIIGNYVEKVQKKYTSLDIGSYPYFKKNSFGVSLVIKGDEENNVTEACEEIYNYILSKNGDPKVF